jgi:hypothetical protein
MSLTALVNGLLNHTPLHNFQLLWILVVAAAWVAATIRWKPFRPFWSHIRQDWTHLSYGFFALTMMLASSVDHDESPRLTLLVLVPSLVTLSGALVHLRAKTRVGRILALVVSLTIALPVWILPISDGMMGSPAARAEVFGILFGGYFLLLAFLLAPALIGLLKRTEPDKGILK